MNRHARYHCGLDATGRRHWRMKPAGAARRCRQQAALLPKIVTLTPTGRERWRNGLHQRRWIMLSVSVRADRWDFLATLPHPPLVSLTPLDGWAVLPRIGERRGQA